MISDQVPKLIEDQFHRHLNVHGKTGPKSWRYLGAVCYSAADW